MKPAAVMNHSTLEGIIHFYDHALFGHSMNRFKKLRVMNLFLIQLGWKLHWFRTLHFAITKQSPMSLIRAGSKLCRTVGLQELGWRPLHKVSQLQLNKWPHWAYMLQWGKKVFSQPPIVQVLPLKKMREACNFHHRYTSTMRDKIRKIQKITL